MMIFAVEVVIVAGLGIYLVRWRASQRRKSTQSWDSLVAQLRTGSSAGGLSDHFLSKEGLNTTPDETWERIQGIRGIRRFIKTQA
jgi:hypothetical protein